MMTWRVLWSGRGCATGSTTVTGVGLDDVVAAFMLLHDEAGIVVLNVEMID